MFQTVSYDLPKELRPYKSKNAKTTWNQVLRVMTSEGPRFISGNIRDYGLEWDAYFYPVVTDVSRRYGYQFI